MKFKTHNEGIPHEGGCLQGHIKVNYKTIKSTFGKPHNSDGYKTDAEWSIKFEDGTYVTIYNYKDGKNYCGKEGIPKTKITDWHIGGSGGQHGIDLIKKALNLGQ